MGRYVGRAKSDIRFYLKSKLNFPTKTTNFQSISSRDEYKLEFYNYSSFEKTRVLGENTQVIFKIHK